jgi:MFS superfamily sulfate permease-like transporter
MQMNGTVFLVGCLCLALTIGLSVARNRWTKIIPPPLTVVLVGLGLGVVFGIDGKHLIEIPDKLKDGMKLPDFRSLFADRALWWTAFSTVLTLTLIDGVESLATIAGIDKIDPYKRKSSPDRTLLAMGISNILSSVAGGLTIIPGGVKSTTCIVTGGKTLWANFYNAIFLLLYLFLGRGFINLIPRAALAAIVVFIGYKLCQPKVWRHAAHVGSEQLLVFCTTVLVTVSTDLLLGIISGMVLEFVLNVSFAWPTARVPGVALAAPAVSGNGAPGLVSRFTDLFRNPVSNREMVDDQYHLYFSRPLVSFNLLHLNRELTRIPQQATIVYFHVGDEVTLIDHTSSSNLMSFAREYEQSGKGQIHFTGLEDMFMCSKEETCVRLGALSVTGAAARGGIGALIAKAGYSLFRARPASALPSRNVVAPATPRFAAPESGDLAFLSLSATSNVPHELDNLGPVPNGDADSELGRLSLSWDGSEPAATRTM